MAKAKPGDSVTNKALYTRISYMHQAAAYLATPSASPSTNVEDATATAPVAAARESVARRLVGDIRTVGQKVLIRQGPGIKRASCKFCDTVFIEGKSCTTTVENASKGGKKPWADVLIVRCKACENIRRYPVASVRQKRKPFRNQEVADISDGKGDGLSNP